MIYIQIYTPIIMIYGKKSSSNTPTRSRVWHFKMKKFSKEDIKNLNKAEKFNKITEWFGVGSDDGEYLEGYIKCKDARTEQSIRNVKNIIFKSTRSKNLKLSPYTSKEAEQYRIHAQEKQKKRRRKEKKQKLKAKIKAIIKRKSKVVTSDDDSDSSDNDDSNDELNDILDDSDNSDSDSDSDTSNSEDEENETAEEKPKLYMRDLVKKLWTHKDKLARNFLELERAKHNGEKQIWKLGKVIYTTTEYEREYGDTNYDFQMLSEFQPDWYDRMHKKTFDGEEYIPGISFDLCLCYDEQMSFYMVKIDWDKFIKYNDYESMHEFIARTIVMNEWIDVSKGHEEIDKLFRVDKPRTNFYLPDSMMSAPLPISTIYKEDYYEEED